VHAATESIPTYRPPPLSVVKAAPAGADRLGDVIIDDYIRTSEPVVDYLTKYSGIAPGDLDPGVSPHNLGATPLPG
jgi:PAB-dependent poly(A)-specific ribonuclease subunit 2